jgi:DNA-binding transcriptional LysR family regulator
MSSPLDPIRPIVVTAPGMSKCLLCYVPCLQGMNIQQLRYLVATADVGTMTGAAASLHVTQPALTRALRTLEFELGVTLLTRVGRRVELTAEGHRVLEVARRVTRDVDSLADIREQTLRVCATATQARELCTGAIARLKEAAPHVLVTIETVDSAADVAAVVEAGRAELGVCDLPVDAPLRCTVLGTQELALVHPIGWDLPDPLPFGAIDGMKIIGPTVTDRRRNEMESTFTAHGIAPSIVVSTDQRDLVIPLVIEGVGATFVWPATARDARRLGASVVGLDPPVRRDVGVLRRPGRLTPAAREVLAALESEAALTLTTTG